MRVIQAPTPGNVVVRKYDPKAAAAVKRRDDEQFLVSPITGERIPANKVTRFYLSIALLILSLDLSIALLDLFNIVSLLVYCSSRPV